MLIYIFIFLIWFIVTTRQWFTMLDMMSENGYHPDYKWNSLGQIIIIFYKMMSKEKDLLKKNQFKRHFVTMLATLLLPVIILKLM